MQCTVHNAMQLDADEQLAIRHIKACSHITEVDIGFIAAQSRCAEDVG